MKILKKIFALTLVLISLFAIVATVSAETPPIPSISVNNQVLLSNCGAEYINGIIMVPASEFSNSLGGSFSFEEATLTGKIVYEEREVVFRLDDIVVKVNGKYIKAPAPMIIKNNRLMVPAEFIASKLGAEAYIRSSKNMLMLFQPTEEKLVYKVISGDTLWIISQLFGTTIANIKQLNGLTGDTLYVGQELVIKNFVQQNLSIQAQTKASATIRSGPGFDFSVVGYIQAYIDISAVGKIGEWYKVTTPKGNGYIYYSVVGIKQDTSDTASDSTFFNNNIPVDTSRDSISYNTYSVQKGDTLWSISEKFGITNSEVAAANNISLNSMLNISQLLKIPVHNIPIKSTVGPQAGEVLDWFKEAQYVFPIGKIGEFVDVETGKSFKAKRTMGASHSDTETVSEADTQIMKEIFGGNWTWNRKSLILKVDGRSFAVSVAGMAHAGIDGVPYLQNVDNRSDNWGFGPNYDRISGNGMNGHFDVYFLNCLRHVDNKIDPSHQLRVMVSGGLK